MRIMTLTTILIGFLILVGCEPFVRRSMTALPAPTLTVVRLPTLTPTVCAYTQNPGPAPEAVVTRAREAFTELNLQGIRGKMDVQAYGEYYCAEFGVMQVNFDYTILVSDLANTDALRGIVSTLKESAKNSVQGWNLGEVSIRFVTGQQCAWNETQNRCQGLTPLDYP